MTGDDATRPAADPTGPTDASTYHLPSRNGSPLVAAVVAVCPAVPAATAHSLGTAAVLFGLVVGLTVG
ncbi:MAG: hypothetical protein ABEI99_03830 [Halobaculum sp.]